MINKIEENIKIVIDSKCLSVIMKLENAARFTMSNGKTNEKKKGNRQIFKHAKTIPTDPDPYEGPKPKMPVKKTEKKKED